MKKFTKEKGITLVALVVTIIVLLILATVSINLVLGESGIITRSKEASIETEISALQEAIKMQSLENNMEDSDDVLEMFGNITDILGEKYIKYEDKYKIEGNKLVYIEGAINENIVPILESMGVEKSSNCLILVNENTKQSKYIDNDLVITFKSLDSKVISQEISKNNYNKIYIMEDINLGATWDEEGNLTSGEQWTPISKIPEGVILEGNNHKIEGVYINTTENKRALVNDNYGIIKNIIFDENNYMKTTVYEMAAICVTNKGEVIKCINNTFMNIDLHEFGTSGGGIVALNKGNIKGCINNADIIGCYYVGGIAGSNTNGEIIECINYGNVQGRSYATAGIVGDTRGGRIIQCINYGNVKSLMHSASGIVETGRDDSSIKFEIESCSNYGNISGAYCMTGICTRLNEGCSVKNCSNFGQIKGNVYEMAGISSYNYGGIISNCYNVGLVTKTNTELRYQDYRINTENTGTITNCYGLNDVLEDGTVVNSDYMKSEAFVNKLGSAFKQDKENKNQGYPLLKWQE